MLLTFKEDFLQKKFQKICKKYKLKPVHIMSTSGTYFVWLCENEKKKKFLVKIRKHKGQNKKIEFTKEILANKNLSNSKKIYFNLKQAPEYLIYQLIAGYSLNEYYFFIAPYAVKKLKSLKPIKTKLKILQKQTDGFTKICLKQKINLEKKYFTENFAFFQKYKKSLNKNFSLKIIKNIEAALLKNKNLFSKNLKIAHGDFHPKNILITSKAKISFIDWSDLHLNNIYFDLAFFWLTSFNVKNLQINLEKSIANKKLFYLNVLIWLPKYFQLLIDAENAAKQEFKSKLINRQQQQNLLKLIKQAKTFYKQKIINILKNV